MQAAQTDYSENVLTETHPGTDVKRQLFLRDPSYPLPRGCISSTHKMSVRDVNNGLSAIDSLNFFQDSLQTPSHFKICPPRVKGGRPSTTDAALNTIYITSRKSNDTTAVLQSEYDHTFGSKDVTATFEQIVKFTLDTLPEEYLKYIRGMDLLAKFSSVGCTIRSIDSVIPTITGTLRDHLKSQDGCLRYVPMGYPPVIRSGSEGSYQWSSVAVPNWIEITFQADSDDTVVHHRYDDKSARALLRTHLGEKAFVIPATSVLKVDAQVQPCHQEIQEATMIAHGVNPAFWGHTTRQW
ncbi:uncharacterized protein L199_004631 [Kwoniella botswanensis]|uniref:uncharacterized protein n=1 Tax=Kwoniella botswanensis TaxID=1268659 RepID=UPI00315CA7F7